MGGRCAERNEEVGELSVDIVNKETKMNGGMRTMHVEVMDIWYAMI